MLPLSDYLSQPFALPAQARFASRYSLREDHPPPGRGLVDASDDIAKHWDPVYGS